MANHKLKKLMMSNEAYCNRCKVLMKLEKAQSEEPKWVCKECGIEKLATMESIFELLIAQLLDETLKDFSCNGCSKA